MSFPQQTFISFLCEEKDNFSLLESITDNTTKMFQIQPLPGKDIIVLHSKMNVEEEQRYFFVVVVGSLLHSFEISFYSWLY